MINFDNASCINDSLSTSKDAVASSIRMIGASFKNARAIEILWRSPPDSSEPFSPIMVSHFCGIFSIKSSQFANFAAAITSSSVASFLPIRMFSIIVLLNSVTS